MAVNTTDEATVDGHPIIANYVPGQTGDAPPAVSRRLHRNIISIIERPASIDFSSGVLRFE